MNERTDICNKVKSKATKLCIALERPDETPRGVINQPREQQYESIVAVMFNKTHEKLHLCPRNGCSEERG